MKKPLIIFGAGGLGREIKTLVDVLPEWETKGFCDDRVAPGAVIMDVPVLGNRKYLKGLGQCHVVIAIGDPRIKQQVAMDLNDIPGVTFATLVHPRAVLADTARIVIGEGSIITAGCILTTAITMGRHVLLNLNTTVGHDSVIGDCSSVMPGVNIAGKVSIGKNVLVGSGANLLNGITLGDNVVIGSGAVVLKDFPSGVTAVGVPARGIPRRVE